MKVCIEEYKQYSGPLLGEIHSFSVDKEITKTVLSYARSIFNLDNIKMNVDHTTKNLAGDIKLEFSLPTVDDNDPRNKLIYDVILNNLKSIPSLSKIKGFDFNTSPWVNVMTANEYNPLHDHSGKISLVWYLQTPKEIKQERIPHGNCKRPRGMIEFVDRDGIYLYDASESTMLIFDSSHRHCVYPFSSKVERISLAANIKKVIV